MSERDRDPTGRAHNARPRDAFGRPLPRGAAGVERVDESLVLSPNESIDYAQRLLDEDKPFHAHEVLEAAWKSAPDGERDLWQGLAQIAVGLTHRQRENRTGAVALLRRGIDRLQPYALAPPHHLRVAGIIDDMSALATDVERDGTRAGPDRALVLLDPRRPEGSRVIRHGAYEIDDDPDRVDVDSVWAYLSTDAYWGRWRRRDDVDRQIRRSWRIVACYDDSGRTVGFARAVSDGVALAYLADVYVLDAHRRRGLGEAMVREMVDNGPGRAFRWMLHTADAHGMYRKFGFSAPDATFMERPGSLTAERAPD